MDDLHRKVDTLNEHTNELLTAVGQVAEASILAARISLFSKRLEFSNWKITRFL